MVKVVKDNRRAIRKAFDRLGRKVVLVGVPAEKAGRGGGGSGSQINNAALRYLNETGDPEMGLPARPHLVPGVEAILPEIQARFGKALYAVLSGEEAKADAELNKVGLAAVASVQLKILEGLPPPLAPKTLYRRKHRKVALRTGEIPLFDTGVYARSITYVIRRRGGKN